MPCKFDSSSFPGRKFPSALNHEVNRLATFVNFGNGNVFPISLAKAGLYHTGYRDEVKCFFCPFKYHDWKTWENPLSIHKIKSPDCSFFSNRITPHCPFLNIPIPPSKKFENIQADVLQTFLRENDINVRRVQASDTDRNKDHSVQLPGVNLRSAPRLTTRVSIPTAADGSFLYSAMCEEEVEKESFPSLSSEEVRWQTFTSFPHEHLKEKLVRHGFFYPGQGDTVLCYSCGLGLYHWLPGDDPDIEHARWSQKCYHLQQVVEPEFIDFIQREMANI